jgi:hypothetical protein
MVNLGKDVFFIADTDAHGRQLWHLNPAVTGVEDPLVAAAVAVYPNPTDGEVTLPAGGGAICRPGNHQYAGPHRESAAKRNHPEHGGVATHHKPAVLVTRAVPAADCGDQRDGKPKDHQKVAVPRDNP